MFEHNGVDGGVRESGYISQKTLGATAVSVPVFSNPPCNQ